jgi:hypothetical protein
MRSYSARGKATARARKVGNMQNGGWRQKAQTSFSTISANLPFCLICILLGLIADFVTADERKLG